MSAPKFTVGDKAYAIRFDINALADYEEAMGKPLDGNTPPGIRGLRALLWGGIRSTFDDQRRDAAPSLLEVGRAMQGCNSKELEGMVWECVKRDFPDAAKEVERSGEGGSSP